MKSERRGFTSSKTVTDPKLQPDLELSISSDGGDDYNDLSSSFSDHNDNNDYTDFLPISPSAPNKSPLSTSRHDTLPWDYTRAQEDDMPVKSQRFAENKFDHVNNTRDIDMKLRNESFAISVPHFAKGENLKTRNLMKNSSLPSVYTSPDEKLKQVNKRLIALKKRVATFEENFEIENGYRPSLSIKLNERYVKSALAEIHKLRKEKQILKADPMIALGYKSAHADNDSKVQKMKDTIAEIEKVCFILFYFISLKFKTLPKQHNNFYIFFLCK